MNAKDQYISCCRLICPNWPATVVRRLTMDFQSLYNRISFVESASWAVPYFYVSVLRTDRDRVHGIENSP